MSEPYRWKATIYFRTEKNGVLDVEHNFMEIEDLHEIVERGPSWQAIERIEVVYCGLPEKLTVEEADAL